MADAAPRFEERVKKMFQHGTSVRRSREEGERPRYRGMLIAPSRGSTLRVFYCMLDVCCRGDYILIYACVSLFIAIRCGEMPERSIGLVSKTSEGATPPRVRIPVSPPNIYNILILNMLYCKAKRYGHNMGIISDPG